MISVADCLEPISTLPRAAQEIGRQSERERKEWGDTHKYAHILALGGAVFAVQSVRLSDHQRAESSEFSCRV